MGEAGQPGSRFGSWQRRAWIALAIFCGLLLIFHRPLLFGLAHRVALHFAAKENLKVEFQIGGNIFTNLTIRNLHVVPVGPSDIESIDVDLARFDYGIFGLLRRGILTGIRKADVRAARVVLNPAKKRLEPSPPNPKKKLELPPLFPEAVRVGDATIVVRNRPHDFVAEHVSLDLDPRRLGEVKVGKLQLVAGQSWSGLAIQTRYADRNLILYNVVLSDRERFRAINIDASQIAAHKLGINIEYEAGEGSISASAKLREAQGSLETAIHVHSAKLPVEALNKYLALPENWMRGEIKLLDVDLSGLLSSPATWSGSAFAQLEDFRHAAGAFDHGQLQLSATNGVAAVEAAEIVQGENRFHLRGSAQLPRDIHELGSAPATLELAATLANLHAVTAGLSQPLGGSAQLNGKIDIRDQKLEANLTALASSVASADGTIEKLSANLRATKQLLESSARRASRNDAAIAEPWFANLRAAIAFSAANVRYRDHLLDAAEGTVESVDNLLTVRTLTLARRQNTVTARGTYRLPQDLRLAASQDLQLDLALSAVDLADFWASDSPDKISGPLQVWAQLNRTRGVANGQLTLFGSNLSARDLVINQLSAQCPIWNNRVYVNDFTARLNERDIVGATGVVDLAAPFHYAGRFLANLSDLSTLEPLLRALGNEKKLKGSLVIDWQGSGAAATFSNSGKLRFALENGRYGSTQALRATADATYTPDGLDVPTIFVATSKMDFQAIAQTRGDTLEISKIQLDQGEAKYASGYVSIPFVWKNLGAGRPLLPAGGKVFATFQSENVDIRKIFEELGLKPPASGIASVKLDAQGSLDDLNARLDVQMRDLRTDKLPDLEAASFQLTAQSQHNQLSISGKLQQPKIQPVELNASLPFNTEKIIRARSLPDDTPLTAKVRLPRSSVNFVRQFVPTVQELDGEVALDVDVSGTVGRPIFSGSGDMTVNVARASNATLPAVRDFKARLNFANDAVTIEKFAGELSGGTFSMTGRVTFPKLTAANLDLQLKADSALIARNDTLTVRTDADINVRGPLNSADVTGTVAMTNSHVLKNLDLIPIGLPGRPAPQPPAARPEFSFPDPPLRDWKFDVKLKTKDPVLIRGSLANGGAASDIHLGGTGLRPTLQGIVRLENVEATLPFSRLEVSSGFVYFDPDDSFNPRLDLHGASVIHDHTIHVYIYGTALEPEAIFTSEPPLPQEEIISLLATGTTREELTGSNNVLAGRAAMLLGQQLYRKIFKKGEPTQTNSVFDRLDVDVGTVDPRTGQQQATARLKINDQWVVVGDIGVSGDYRGMLKYLIRFR